MDDRFYVIVSGYASAWKANGEGLGYAWPKATVSARRAMWPMARSARPRPFARMRPVTILERQRNAPGTGVLACQLRFNKVFLRSLIERLQG